MKSTIRFGDMVKDFHGKGGFPARDLLPLIPPGAKLSSASQVKDHQIGKIPGRFSNGVWSGLSGPWPTFGLAERDQIAASDWPTQNVGLRAADFPGIDCDTASKEALALTEDVIARVFGEGSAPVRERGNAPRALFVFRRSGEDPIRKTRIVFTDTDKVEHAVEVLGLGQQYVISGIHPSGVAYEWREKKLADGKLIRRDLVTTRAAGLKGITAVDVNRFMATLQREIQARGWTVTSTIAPKYGEGGREGGVLLKEAEPTLEEDIAVEVALSALTAIPNTEETLPTRESFVALLSSFKHCLGKLATDSLLPKVIGWAQAEDPSFAPAEWVEKIWYSLTSSRVSPDLLLNTARKYGWRGDAVLDFEEFGDDGSAQQTKEMTTAEKIERAQATEHNTREALQVLADKLVYWVSEQIFIVRDTGEMLSGEALNKSSYGTAVAPAGSTGQRSTANLLHNSHLVREVAGVVYLPGDAQLTQWTQNGREGLFYNKWHTHHHALPASVTDDDVRPWLDHVDYLVPEKGEQKLLLDFLAHLVQKRGQKVRWAPLLIGKQGTGKDLLVKPLMMFMGHNAQDLKPEQLTARFNGFLENELLIVQEMKRSNRSSGVYNSIKTLMSGTAADVNMVEQKYKSPYAVPNTVNMIFFSNHLDAIEIDPDDRRFFVIMSDVSKREYEYYRRLAEDFYSAASGWRKVVRWLQQRDLTGFNASESPTETGSKELMVETQRSSLFLALENYLERSQAGVVTASDLFDMVKQDFNFPIDNQTRARVETVATVTSELSHLGWVRVRTPVRLSDGKLARLWARSEAIAAQPASTLRRFYEETGERVVVSPDSEF